MRGLWRIRRWLRQRREAQLLAAARPRLARFPAQETRRPHGLPGELIVTLTSYPARFPTLALTLKCLLDQTVAADRTILWLGHGDGAKLPQDVLDLQAHGLEIRETEDTRSFKKIIPALTLYPGAFLLTVDDDALYEPHLIETLVGGYEPTLRNIVARRAHRAALRPDGRLTRYQSWKLGVRDTQDPDARHLLFFTGVGGVLYPPHSLAPEVLDREQFQRLCPHGDDIWLFWMARRAGTPVRRVGKVEPVVNWAGSQETSLVQHNMFGRNDDQIRAMEEALGPA